MRDATATPAFEPRSLYEVEMERRAQNWNALIPKRARVVKPRHDDEVRYLHPTKGYRRVAKSRLGIGR